MREVNISIVKATIGQYDLVVSGLDAILPAEGFGFVNKLQIKTEIKRGSVYIGYYQTDVAGYRIGKDRLWNIAVHKQFRGLGIGKALLLHRRPSIIRVKNNPIGHLSKQQRHSFVDPTPFYESLGYKKLCEDYGRNFWQKGGDKAQFHKTGSQKHISIYIDEQSFLFSTDDMRGQNE